MWGEVEVLGSVRVEGEERVARRVSGRPGAEGAERVWVEVVFVVLEGWAAEGARRSDCEGVSGLAEEKGKSGKAR